MRRLILVTLLLTASAADAAERRWPVASVERLRVEAPIAVRVRTSAAAGDAATGVRATAPDRATLDALSVTVNGDTLVIRSAARTPLAGEVLVATPRLSTVAVFAPAAVTVDAMRAGRATLSVSGAGVVRVGQVSADVLSATLVGEGDITVGGRATDVRLTGNGPGTIDAASLRADRLAVSAGGDLIVRAAARDAAQVVAGPDTQVTIAGRPRCTVRATPPAVVRCGEDQRTPAPPR